MILELEEIMKKTKLLRELMLKINHLLGEENPFDRLLVLVCMGKGGFLPLQSLPNSYTMNLICNSSELFEDLFPYLDQQFLYQCMDESTQSEIIQCVSTVKQKNINKTVKEEYYNKAMTIFYQVLYDTIAKKEPLWEEFCYRLVNHWKHLDQDMFYKSNY